MLKYLLGLFFFLSFCAKAQQNDSSTIYYDRTWHVLVDNSNEVFYIRKAIKKDDIWYVNDYYKANNVLQMSGAYKRFLDSTKVGNFKYFFDKGQLSKEGHFTDGKRDGLWREWHNNGNVSYVGNFKEGYLVGKYESWWDNGNKYCEIQYLDDISKIKSFEKKDTLGKTIIRTGVMVGTCKFYFENGIMSSKEEWSNDSLIALEIWDNKGISEKPSIDKNGRLTCEVVPEFKSGTTGLMKYLANSIRYPNKSRKSKEEGRVFVNFVVNKNGDIEDVKVLKSSGYTLLDKETMRVVNTMSGMWTPGKQHNQQVRVFYTLPVTFKLQS